MFNYLYEDSLKSTIFETLKNPELYDKNEINYKLIQISTNLLNHAVKLKHTPEEILPAVENFTMIIKILLYRMGWERLGMIMAKNNLLMKVVQEKMDDGPGKSFLKAISRSTYYQKRAEQENGLLMDQFNNELTRLSLTGEINKEEVTMS